MAVASLRSGLVLVHEPASGALARALSELGWEVLPVGSRWDALVTSPADLWAVDLTSMGFDPLLILEAFTQQRVNVPLLLVLTERHLEREADRLLPLSKEWLGPFDMLVVPYLQQELALRASWLQEQRAAPRTEKLYDFGLLRLDVQRHSATVAGQRLPLTLTEFRILHDLVAAAGRVVSKEALGRHIRAQSRGREQAAEVHVRRLRQKLVAGGLDGRVIRAVRSIGYQLDT